jgi:hypothetical protein
MRKGISPHILQSAETKRFVPNVLMFNSPELEEDSRAAIFMSRIILER